MTNQQKTVFEDRESWLAEASDMLLDEVIIPVCESHRVKPLLRVSCGWPRGSRGSKSRRGHTYLREDSSDGLNEIFISPEIAEPLIVLDVLTHELIHAVLDNNTVHSGEFRVIARKIGLEGPLHTTHAGPELTQGFNILVDDLGLYPHAPIQAPVKKQATRQIKCECIECGLIARMSQTAINEAEERVKSNPSGFLYCPAGCPGASMKTNV